VCNSQYFLFFVPMHNNRLLHTVYNSTWNLQLRGYQNTQKYLKYAVYGFVHWSCFIHCIDIAVELEASVHLKTACTVSTAYWRGSWVPYGTSPTAHQFPLRCPLPFFLL
jgi:hypothetical protein